MADAPQEQIAPLLNREGWELLASLGPYREDEAIRLNASLRKAGHSPELASAVLTQSRLRTKAEAKFAIRPADDLHPVRPGAGHPDHSRGPARGTVREAGDRPCGGSRLRARR